MALTARPSTDPSAVAISAPTPVTSVSAAMTTVAKILPAHGLARVHTPLGEPHEIAYFWCKELTWWEKLSTP